MNDVTNDEGKAAGAADDQRIVSLLKEIMVKLELMEGKVDALTRDARQKAFKEKSFSKPRSTFGRPGAPARRKFEGKKEEVSSEGKFYHGRPFAKKKPGGKSSFSKGKKPYKK